MNRATRDKFASLTDQQSLTSGTACWETPPAVFAKLHQEYRFDLDLTADAQRHLLPIWFGPDSPVGQFDVLTAPWFSYGSTGYSNPPYGRFVMPLLAVARAHARLSGFTSVFLLPMRVTKAFRGHVLHGASELLFCDKRITFYENGAPPLNPKTGKPDAALFDSIVVVFRPGTWDRPQVGEWHVPVHV